MDVIQDWAWYLFQMSPTYASPVYRGFSLVRTYLLPLIERVTQKPDLATIALLIVVLFLSLKMLDMLRRAVMFWVNLAIRVLLWSTIAFVGIYVWTRGPEGAIEDAQEVFRYWGGEYQYWKEKADAAANHQRQQMGGRGGNTGRTGWR